MRTRFFVGLFMVIRIVLHTPLRMAYPFLAVFARGLGVELSSVSLAITTRTLFGALTPVFAVLADRYGRKITMMISVGLFTLGTGLVVVRPGYITFFAALCLTYFGMSVFIVSAHAYVGDKIPYEQRGRAMAAIEISWAASFVVAVPLMGLLIGRIGWQAPFWLLTGLGILAFVLLALLVPPLRDRKSRAKTNSAVLVKRVFATPAARLILLMSALLMASNEMINMMFGVWLEDSLGLKIAVLGAASAVIGIAELSGELISGGIMDKIGKEKSIAIGLLSNGVIAAILPWLDAHLWSVLIGLFFFYISFEFTVVSFLVLVSETVPSARATLLGVNFAIVSLGRSVGTLLAPVIYTLGYHYNGLLTLLLNLMVFAILSKVRITPPQQPNLTETNQTID